RLGAVPDKCQVDVAELSGGDLERHNKCVVAAERSGPARRAVFGRGAHPAGDFGAEALQDFRTRHHHWPSSHTLDETAQLRLTRTAARPLAVASRPTNSMLFRRLT